MRTPDNAAHKLALVPRRILISAIMLYQRTLSPDHGPLKALHPYGYCRHEPTCSEYGKIEIGKRGALVGTFRLVQRVLTCVPWKKPSEEKIRRILGT